MKEFIEKSMKKRILTHLKKKRNNIFEESKEYHSEISKNYFMTTIDTYDEIIKDIEKFEED